MISFAPQDLFARTWGGSPFSAAPHAPFIGSFHPQIAQGLAPSFSSSPWIGSSFSASPWTNGGFGGGFGAAPLGGGTLNPFGLAVQAGLSPFTGWQNPGLPLNAFGASGASDLSLALARQSYLPGFYPSSYFAGIHPALLAGSYLAGGHGFSTPGFGA